MEFWGVEVKAGASLKVTPDENKLIHISQAALGEVKNNKGADSVPLRLKIDDGKFVLGTLAAVTRPQLTFDLVFEKEFELSHDWKNGSVYFCGYTADNPYDDNEIESDTEFGSEDEELALETLENGKLELNVEKAKPAKSIAAPAKPESSTKSKVTAVPKKDEDDSDDEEDSDEDDSDDVAEFGSDDDMSEDDESDDDDDEDEDEDEETPKKPVSAKKRPSESVLKTPVQAKKAKADTPQKSDGKKGGVHTATPHPAKKAEKTPASKNKGKEQSPKSGANIKCNSCTKTFTSDGALQSHSKAKHSAAK